MRVRIQMKLVDALEDEVKKEIALYTDERWGDKPAPDYVVEGAIDAVIRRCVLRGGCA